MFCIVCLQLICSNEISPNLAISLNLHFDIWYIFVIYFIKYFSYNFAFCKNNSDQNHFSI